ncbi:hypothetical protein V1503_01520 [Bacillus sp. SCS-151]|uniref:hypothetical protein n=1 Tax=Nanhaiella sioensis TaxID=3115293 RepID=UPI003978BF8D
MLRTKDEAKVATDNPTEVRVEIATEKARKEITEEAVEEQAEKDNVNLLIRYV